MNELDRFDEDLDGVRAIESRSIEREDTTTRTVYRYTASPPTGLGWTGGIVRSALGDDALRWDEHGQWDHESHECHWTIEPCSVPDVLSIACSGRNDYQATTDGAVIEISGKLSLGGIPGVSGMEAFVIKQVRQNLDDIGAALDRYLRLGEGTDEHDPAHDQG